MQRTAHVYPYSPHGLHGGTLRLRTALAASEAPELWAFDAGRWHGPLAPSSLRDEAPVSGAPRTGLQRAKRSLFPATLWESGRRPARALRVTQDRPPWGEGDRVVLHSTYLAPLVPWARSRGARVIVDVYDLVWRAHALDAAAARGLVRAVRSAYSATVRARELPALARADAVVVAGYADHRALSAELPGARWAPTGIPGAERTDRRPGPNGTLRVGVLGHFGHEPTREAAQRLLDSPLGRDRRVEVVLAGLESDGAFPGRARVRALGAVASVEDFYGSVDCVVVPAASGAGIKVKLGEAVLAGIPAATTELGAAGYPPELRARFLVEDDPARLTPERCREHLRAFDVEAARAEFAAAVGWDAAVGCYRQGIESSRP